MRAVMLLCDSAQVADGKLYILGGGWSVTGPGPTQMAIALRIDVPWDETNRTHHIRLELMDGDGNAVMLPGPMGEVAVFFEGDFEVGRPPGVHPGTPMVVPLAFGMGPMQLLPGNRYTWKLSIDGEEDENWQVGFSTRRADTPPGPMTAQ
jgi:hypothetical protein